MKTRATLFAILLIIAVLTACGKRTAPTPMADGVSGDVMQKEWLGIAKYKGTDLELIIPIPKHLTPGKGTAEEGAIDKAGLKWLMIGIDETFSTCARCDNRPLGKVAVDLKARNVQLNISTEDGGNKLNGVIGSAGIRLDFINENLVKLTFSASLFKGVNSMKDILFKASIQYELDEAGIQLGYIRPREYKTLPLPSVNVKILVPKEKIEGAPDWEVFSVDDWSEVSMEQKQRAQLLLDWPLVIEYISHVVDGGGNPSEVEHVYGVNLYQVNKGNLSQTGMSVDTFTENQLINDKPLMYGTYQIETITGPIIARFEDRYGNESAYALVFDDK